MKKKICVIFQSTHQVDMKNGVEFYKDCFGYFNALKTNCGKLSIQNFMKILPKIKGKLTSEISLDQRFHDTGIVSDTRGHDLFSHSQSE